MWKSNIGSQISITSLDFIKVYILYYRFLSPIEFVLYVSFHRILKFSVNFLAYLQDSAKFTIAPQDFHKFFASFFLATTPVTAEEKAAKYVL